jgi:hypothetical protein
VLEGAYASAPYGAAEYCALDEPMAVAGCAGMRTDGARFDSGTSSVGKKMTSDVSGAFSSGRPRSAVGANGDPAATGGIVVDHDFDERLEGELSTWIAESASGHMPRREHKRQSYGQLRGRCVEKMTPYRRSSKTSSDHR